MSNDLKYFISMNANELPPGITVTISQLIDHNCYGIAYGSVWQTMLGLLLRFSCQMGERKAKLGNQAMSI